MVSYCSYKYDFSLMNTILNPFIYITTYLTNHPWPLTNTCPHCHQHDLWWPDEYKTVSLTNTDPHLFCKYNPSLLTNINLIHLTKSNPYLLWIWTFILLWMQSLTSHWFTLTFYKYEPAPCMNMKFHYWIQILTLKHEPSLSNTSSHAWIWTPISQMWTISQIKTLTPLGYDPI